MHSFLKSIPSSRLLPLLLIAGAFSIGRAPAAVYSAAWTTGFANGGTIPDGNILGWSDARSLAIPADQTVVDVNVEFSVSGGWTGDLYAYLSHPDAPDAVVLLNRSGRTSLNPFGYTDSLLTITLDDASPRADLHGYQTTPGYAALITNNSTWQPDGRAVSPLTVNGTESRTATLSLLNGISPGSDDWTLFVADVSSGEQMAVTRWALTVTTIPEPAGTGLLGLLAAPVLLRRRRR